MNAQDIPKTGKFRHEHKYLCSAGELRIIEARIRPLMKQDPHAGPDGRYRITSLYFDDLYDTCYRENLDGVSPRSKWRIRYYGTDTGRLMLECKHKAHDMVMKEQCLLTGRQFASLVSDSLAGSRIAASETEEEPALLRRFRMEKAVKGLKPVVTVRYERKPYIYAPGNVRVTLDHNIESLPASGFLTDSAGRPVQPDGQHLMEVKYDEFLPDVLFHAIQMKNMRRTAFSKYCLCRKYSLYEIPSARGGELHNIQEGTC